MDEDTVLVWVTKYALTCGIQLVEAKALGGMIVYGPTGPGRQTAHGKDWHLTPTAAVARAEEMRLAKIKSLHKKLAELKGLTFTAPTEHGE